MKCSVAIVKSAQINHEWIDQLIEELNHDMRDFQFYLIPNQNLNHHYQVKNSSMIIYLTEQYGTEEIQLLLDTMQSEQKMLPIHLAENRLLIGPWSTKKLTSILSLADQIGKVQGKQVYFDLVYHPQLIAHIASLIYFELNKVIQKLERYDYFYMCTNKGEFVQSYFLSSTYKDQEIGDENRIFLHLKRNKASYRLHNPYLSYESLRKYVVHSMLSDVKEVHYEEVQTVKFFHPSTKLEGSGKGLTMRERKCSGLLEYLERYAASLIPEEIVISSWSSLQEEAVDPRDLGLYKSEAYQEHSDILQSYTNELEQEWVQCYSYLEQQIKWIPLQATHYLAPVKNRFILENSNGCAIGNSKEEATLYGLFEHIERDAFLTVWYSQSEVDEIDISSIEDLDVLLMVEQLRIDGYQVRLFNITLDFKVPCVWAMILGNDSSKLATYSSSSAHLDIDKAVKDALSEVYYVYRANEQQMKKDQNRRSRLLQSDQHVQSMEDHYLLYSSPEMMERFHFLLNTKKKTTLHKLREQYFYRGIDIKEELQYVVQNILDQGYDVLVCDQTPKEFTPFHLYVVKTIVPGLQTLDFGHDFQRIVWERVILKPYELGLVHRIKSPSELPLYIHPFP